MIVTTFLNGIPHASLNGGPYHQHSPVKMARPDVGGALMRLQSTLRCSPSQVAQTHGARWPAFS